MKRLYFLLWAFLSAGSGCQSSQEYSGIRNQPDGGPSLQIWYGTHQHFGQLGTPQRWINVPGNVSKPWEIEKLEFRLNDGEPQSLALGSDQHRLANMGDFNVELRWDEVNGGNNELVLTAYRRSGPPVTTTVTLQVEKENTWPLPYRVDFTRVKNIQDVAQVVDGRWHLEEDGIRTTVPYYDRVLAIGDTSWMDYTATIRLTIHDFIPPEPGPPTYNATHFGVAMRWRGHHQPEKDKSLIRYIKILFKGQEQPYRKWYPLGAQGELLLKSRDSCRWRVLFDGDFKTKPARYADSSSPLVIGKPIFIKTEVFTLPDGRSCYRYKQWPEGSPEPESWDVEGFESGDYSSGALCLVPHHSDVTIHEVAIEPLNIL